MRSLYDRFRQEVVSGGAIDYYELNELLDIYDYAQDEGDIMVQMFVFMTAARLYPSNKDFDERIAFFMSYITPEAARDMLSRSGRQDSALWDILKMGVDCYPLEDPEPYVKDILTKYQNLDCESILKMIDLLRDMGRRDLLVKYYTEISQRADDPRGIAFEIAETVKEEPELQDEARKIAEELTKLEPFNVDAWLMLARIEFGLEHPNDALAAVDYALAIEPDHFNARLTRGVIMVVIDERRDEAIEVLQELRLEQPSNAYILEGLAEAYARSNRVNEACDLYAEVIEKNIVLPTNADPIVAIAELEPENLDKYLKIFLQSEAGSGVWRERAEQLIAKGKVVSAARMLDFEYKNRGLNSEVDYFLHTLFDAHMYDRYEQVMEEISDKFKMPIMRAELFDLVDYLLLSALYLRKGRKEEAAKLSKVIESKQPASASMDEHFKVRGVRLTARFIYTLATTENLDIDLSTFDPLSADFFSEE
jgi:tetratricopeptide (TPR) repeat protein